MAYPTGIHLANRNKTYNYLSRPRRFGKSLLVDTLEAYFLGKKELFEGSGKNRIVRRIFESLGYRVTKLDRVQFAGLTPECSL